MVVWSHWCDKMVERRRIPIVIHDASLRSSGFESVVKDVV